MRNILKSVVAFLLGLAARGVIRRYRPTIVMVTGSVGKTSTKDAVAAVLSKGFLVRKSEKSFNSEFGVPFTIFGVGNPWGNPLAWVQVVKSACALLLLPNHYPNMLVLEVGADKPGDLARILRITTPDAVIVTRLPDIPVHVEAYATPEEVQEEEFSPAYALRPAAPLIISADKPHQREMAARTSARVLSYGTSPEATIRAGKAEYYKEGKTVVGMRTELTLGDETAHVVIRGSVGEIQILPIAAAVLAGHAFGITLTEAVEALAQYTPPAGRGRLLRGMTDSIIIDDSYNASPVAAEEALETLSHFPGARRRVAVLGDMLELGRYSVQEHERIGALAGKHADVVIAVGIRAQTIARSATGAQVLHFDTAYAAASALPGLTQAGDVILVKGSQSIRTERIVEALLADPEDRIKLVRQEPEWKRKS